MRSAPRPDADADPDGVADALDRHERRRAAGVPTVSVLAGPVGLGVRAARRWAGARGRAVAAVDEPREDRAAGAWVARLAAGRDLRCDALDRLARRDGRTPEALGAALDRMTPFERAAYLDAALPAATGADAACRAVLAPEPGDLVGRLEASLANRRPGGWAAVAALRELVPAGCDPVLVLSPRGAAPVAPAWAGAAARLLGGLAEALPGLAVVLAATDADLDAIRGRDPASRAGALLRGAVVRVAGLDGAAILRRLDDPPGLARGLDASARRLAADGASDALVTLFRAAAAAVVAARADPAAADRARSAAERFLFERLESLAATAGLFRLNARVDGVRFGAAAVEVDLLAEGPRVALEVDGYHHFRDADAYRRDRRKDLALQGAGYLVVRVLADDVVARLEDVLATVLPAVAARPGGEPGSERA